MNKYDYWKLSYPQHYDEEVHPLDCQDKIGQTVEFLCKVTGTNLRKYISGKVLQADKESVTILESDYEIKYYYHDLSEIP